MRQVSLICLAPKFFAKIKILKFGTKIPDLGIFGLEFDNNIVIFDITKVDFV